MNNDKGLTLGQKQEKIGKKLIDDVRNQINKMESLNTLVKNVKKTGNDTSPKGYTSWRNYWEKQTDTKQNICSKIGCDRTENIDGVHVQKANSRDKKYYIVPLCHECNEREDVKFYVSVKLIPVPED